MSPRVKVTFTALVANFNPALRVLTLDADCTSVPIGRASKTLSKGLQGARDNAWFDSPVMSRDHAELLLNLETSTISIRDIGSMHGTYLNGHRIPASYPTKLENGDEIVFGSEVRRGMETFPACRFRIDYEIGTYQPTNTYSFPETSDVDDAGEEFDISDVESVHDQVSVVEGLLDVDSDELKVSQSHFPIDLTRDESPVRHSFPSIDLTGDTPVEPKPTEVSPVYAPESDAVLEQIAVEPVGLDMEFDSQSSQYSSDSESDTESRHFFDEEELGEEPVLDDNREQAEENGEQLLVEDNGELDQDDDDNYSSEGHYDSDIATGSRSLNSEDAEFWERSSIATSSSPTVIKGVERMANADGDVPNFGWSNQPQLNADKISLQSAPGRPTYPKCSYQAPGPTSGMALNVLNSSTVLPVPDLWPNTLNFVTPLQPAFCNREPSPSDAAMAKSPEKKEPHVQTSYIRPSTALGDGSGKEDFFKAREHNKAKLQEISRHQEATSSPYTHSPEPEVEIHKPSIPGRVIKPCVAKRMRLLRSLAVDDDGAPLVLPDLINPPMPDRQADPSTGPVSQPSAEPQAVRSGLRIDEIIDRESVSQTAVPPAKRKQDEISQATEEDVRVWTSASTPIDASINVGFVSALQGTTTSPLEISQLSEHRPTKRLRKLMENVGFAALGGVAVGAVLFGSLVASAPEFM